MHSLESDAKLVRLDCKPGRHLSHSRVPGEAGVIVAAILAATLFSAVPGYGDSTRYVDVAIKNGAVVGKKSVRVLKGDRVVLRWTSDKAVELHLHGYDVKRLVSPGKSAEMKIRAHATGSFPVEIHAEGDRSRGHGRNTVFHLEVYPD
jgi:hypothetical protein